MTNLALATPPTTVENIDHHPEHQLQENQQ